MWELHHELFVTVYFALFLSLISADCVDLDLGMENGAIPDSQITASSELSADTLDKNGRLNYISGSSWCAGTSDTNPYLQIDLQTLHVICAVSTQGNSQADQWVKSYTLQLSTDGTTWTEYKEAGKVKTFQGNNDRSSVVKTVLYESLGARYLRILPNAYHGASCIRMEVFGVKLKPVNVALGKATLQSSTFNNTQLGVSGVSEKAVDSNSDTEFRNGSCTHTQKDNPSWWRVDLGSDKEAVSDIFIVNRFSTLTVPMARSENYKITFGDNPRVENNTQCKGLYSFVNFTASAVCFTNPLTTGRYIGISTINEQSLQLCEVEIYLRDNLAFGKQTDQSSVQYGGVSSRAVDGISNPSFYARSCTHTANESNPWWRVDLGQVEPVSELYLVNQVEEWYYRQNNFEIRVGTVSANGGITNPRCGDKQSYSLPRGQGVSFFCRPVLLGRYVTVRSLRTGAASDHFTLCEVEVYSERRACQMQALGVASTDTLPDASFSASSESINFEAFKGRLNTNGGWLPNRNDKPDDYLQIDLQYEFLICAVATQGMSTSDGWTTEYKLQLSFDGSTFVTYKENNVDKIFNGNSGRNDIVKHNLRDIRARYIRFQPVKFQRDKTLRVEVYGVLISKVPSQAPSNLTLSSRSSISITASWQLPPAYSRHGIITGFKLFYKKKGFRGSMNVLTINSGTTFSEDITGLDKYTEYEFQVLAFTSHGDGPKSSAVVEITMRNGACTDWDLGLENDRISDGNIAASSERNARTPAKNGRLNYTLGSSWCAGTSDTNPYLQIDLQTLHIICAVSTQGNSRADQWVKNYRLQLSLDGTTWTDYREDGKVKVFMGNDDRNSQVRHVVYGLQTRYVRFRPQTYQGGVCMRTEVFGVKSRPACHSPAIGVARDDAIPDSSFSASTHYSRWYRPWFARLKRNTSYDRGWAPRSTDDLNDYLQIDLLYDYLICAVATQGARTIDEWTTKYKIQLSLDGATFNIYKEDNTEKVFNGNSGRNDIVKNDLREYALARFIRFVPTAYHNYKVLRVEVYGILLSAGPSKVPGNFTVTAISSTSIRASWTSLPEYARHGTITGYKLYYRQKGSVDNSHMVSISGGATSTKDVTNLDKYTKYEFQVLAVGPLDEGPKSSVKVEQTLEDAPSIPLNLLQSEIMPDKPAGPKIKLTWRKPAEENGIIRSYTVFYSHNEDPHNIHTETLGGNMLSYTVDVLGGVTYQFHVRAVTIKPGPNATVSVLTNDYEPSVAPNDVSFSRLNQTTFNVSWSPLTRKASYSKVTSYEIKASLTYSEKRKNRPPANSKSINSTRAFVILYDIQPCYGVSVRAYTAAGPGPYSRPLPLETSRPEAPNEVRARNHHTTEITLVWEGPQLGVGKSVKYRVEYTGTKSYNKSFTDEGMVNVKVTTVCTVENLVPGTRYRFQVYAISECGTQGPTTYINEETRLEAPVAPVALKITNVEISDFTAEIDLWPAEQRNGPISAYQIIILKVTDCVQELPRDFDVKLKDSNDKELNFYPFYIAAEIENESVRDKSWKFAVGDGKSYGTFTNKELRRGENYIAYQRAITRHNGQILEGGASKVALISVTPESLKNTEETVKGNVSECQVLRVGVIALSCVVFVLLIVIGALIWQLKRTESQERTTTVYSEIPVRSGGQKVSEPSVYMELHPRPSEGKLREPPEYQALPATNVTPDYYDMGLERGNSGKKDGGIYENFLS